MDPATIFIPLAAFGLGALFTSLRILWEYERGVIFRLGKLTRAKGPGLIVSGRFLWLATRNSRSIPFRAPILPRLTR